MNVAETKLENFVHAVAQCDGIMPEASEHFRQQSIVTTHVPYVVDEWKPYTVVRHYSMSHAMCERGRITHITFSKLADVLRCGDAGKQSFRGDPPGDDDHAILAIASPKRAKALPAGLARSSVVHVFCLSAIQLTIDMLCNLFFGHHRTQEEDGSRSTKRMSPVRRSDDKTVSPALE